MFWRTPDTPENDAAFPARHMPETRRSTRRSKMVCQLELTSHPADGCSLRHDEEQRK
ncbi:putative transposase [Shigella flexneri K-227]|uniref:Putative transposase n=1 Tax=Shigella flexneri K-227 TaxID=766147 RepID=F5P237_SHIFL|nr:putative transposase [Shigella flexneri K-227]